MKVDKNYVGSHLANPIHCGWLVPKKSKEPRKADLTQIYPLQYGEDFPIVVTVEEFKRVNPNLFKDTAKPTRNVPRRSAYPLPSSKVLCTVRRAQNLLATMTPNQPRSGGGTLSPRFSCQRCKPQHSIGMDDVFDDIGEELKKVKITEEQHEMLVIAEWENYKVEREAAETEMRSNAALKAKNEKDTEETKERLNAMKYPKPSATAEEIATEERKLKRLEDERKSLLKREEKIGDESMERYYELDAFLELARNGSLWWSKASPDKKRKLADLVVSNAVVDIDGTATVSLTPDFEEWSKREKTDDGRDDRT